MFRFAELAAVVVDLLHCTYDIGEFRWVFERHARPGCLSEQHQPGAGNTGLRTRHGS
jgi:hypothetical protein